ncbi:magnesium/cobalt transporter CorA [Enhydrobacter sp.]|jgi:magnesium transporter|uniref:magnesium/cobalt transporter CorA n=1 Tax=Enhydrobacter sp. TaxID=1894999 RepID=UPI00261BE056|nr:magnesium/cobalt transporter CorA [Enhydrobacter sp.]WIM13642.1 MAG: Magnesium and cobalt transport protein CorA [Enhydrobacter sp.]
MDGLVHRHTPPGTAPGLLTGRAPVADEALDFTLVEYTPERCEVLHGVEVDECQFHLRTPSHTWIDVAGRASSEMLSELGRAFNLHPLALEDVFHANQRSKLDIYDGQGFVVLNDPAYEDGEIRLRQVSIFFSKNYVISFHDHKLDIFKPVRDRLQAAGSRLRTLDVDYLVYALVDLVVDRKFPLIEALANHLELLEDEALGHPTETTLSHIHQARRALVTFHRLQWAERETILAMMRPETPVISADTRTYLRDCFDHSIAVLDLLESYREMCNGLMEVYLMQASNRMSEVMKTLAVITAFFMPLSFLAGVYGMNFDREAGNMPELGWRHGYLFFWGLTAVIVLGLLLWMRRKRWL